MLRSLRSRVIAGMTVLIMLVFAIAMLGVNSIDSLDRSVDRELSLLLESTDLSNGLVASTRFRGRRGRAVPAPALREPSSGACSTRAIRPTLISGVTATLDALTTSDRYIVNKIAANQAEIEVAYATAHALADLGRNDEARRQAERARAPADTLLGDVRALILAQNNRSLVRANELRETRPTAPLAVVAPLLSVARSRRGHLGVHGIAGRTGRSGGW